MAASVKNDFTKNDFTNIDTCLPKTKMDID